MSFLVLEGVSKGYSVNGSRAPVLTDIDLRIEQGEFVAIVGYSGAGKTTLISLIAGLLEPDGGRILFQGRKITGPGPDRGVVFQNYSLLPWLTVHENILLDRKSTRLNSSHSQTSYAVFCWKKKKAHIHRGPT